MRLPQPSHQIPTKQLTHLCISPIPQLSDIENNDDEGTHRGANESLTNIDFRDILGAKLTFTHLDSLLILLRLTYPFPSASQVI